MPFHMKGSSPSCGEALFLTLQHSQSRTMLLSHHACQSKHKPLMDKVELNSQYTIWMGDKILSRSGLSRKEVSPVTEQVPVITAFNTSSDNSIDNTVVTL